MVCDFIMTTIIGINAYPAHKTDSTMSAVIQDFDSIEDTPSALLSTI